MMKGKGEILAEQIGMCVNSGNDNFLVYLKPNHEKIRFDVGFPLSLVVLN